MLFRSSDEEEADRSIEPVVVVSRAQPLRAMAPTITMPATVLRSLDACFMERNPVSLVSGAERAMIRPLLKDRTGSRNILLTLMEG